jgi:hypothetical protein
MGRKHTKKALLQKQQGQSMLKRIRRGDQWSPVDFATGKIHRRKAKTGIFPWGKFEKLRFSTGDH